MLTKELFEGVQLSTHYPVFLKALQENQSRITLGWIMERIVSGSPTEIQGAVTAVSLQESFFRSAWESISNSFKKMYKDSVSAIKSGLSISKLVNEIQKDLPKYERSAKKIEKEKKIIVTPVTTERMLRDLQKSMGRSPAMHPKVYQSLKVYLGESSSHMEDGTWSSTLWVDKFILLYALWSILKATAVIKAGVVTGWTVNLIMIPFLVYMVRKLLKEYTDPDMRQTP